MKGKERQDMPKLNKIDIITHNTINVLLDKLEMLLLLNHTGLSYTTEELKY